VTKASGARTGAEKRRKRKGGNPHGGPGGGGVAGSLRRLRKSMEKGIKGR
jgi:hypothetical protein